MNGSMESKQVSFARGLARVLSCASMLAMGACSSVGAEHGSLFEVELVATRGSEVFQDAVAFELDEQGTFDAIHDVNVLADELAEMNEPAPDEDSIAIAVRVDGAVVMQRRISGLDAPRAEALVTPFIESLDVDTERGAPGVAVAAVSAKTVIGRIWAKICSSCGSDDSGSGGGGGIRG